jgi:Cu+-exporting ATPase
MATTTAPAGVPVTDIELSIGGMTCASCANRIERKLNELDGVNVTVNYATEKARGSSLAGIDPAVFVAQVEATGYTAQLPRAETADEPDPTRPLRDRLVTSVTLSVPVIAMAMIPALQFTSWQWISLLGVRLQRCRPTARRSRAAQSDARRGRHAFSSGFVVANSLRLRNFAPQAGN